MLKIAIITTVVGGTLMAGNMYFSATADRQALDTEDKNTEEVSKINSFNDCVEAGYPVMESFPEQCATEDGRTFTNTNAVLPVENGIAVGEPYGTPAPESDDSTAAIAAAKAHIANDLATTEKAINLITITKEEWPDSCLGLPEEDEMCAMMMVSGYKVTLDADGETVTYRTNQNGTMVKRVPE